MSLLDAQEFHTLVPSLTSLPREKLMYRNVPADHVLLPAARLLSTLQSSLLCLKADNKSLCAASAINPLHSQSTTALLSSKHHELYVPSSHSG